MRSWRGNPRSRTRPAAPGRNPARVRTAGEGPRSPRASRPTFQGATARALTSRSSPFRHPCGPPRIDRRLLRPFQSRPGPGHTKVRRPLRPPRRRGPYRSTTRMSRLALSRLEPRLVPRWGARPAPLNRPRRQEIRSPARTGEPHQSELVENFQWTAKRRLRSTVRRQRRVNSLRTAEKARPVCQRSRLQTRLLKGTNGSKQQRQITPSRRFERREARPHTETCRVRRALCGRSAVRQTRRPPACKRAEVPSQLRRPRHRRAGTRLERGSISDRRGRSRWPSRTLSRIGR
jgi:hypothetical protein